MKNEIIELISYTESKDADGFPIKAENCFLAFADVQKAKRSEFYQAQTAGINVQLVAIINLDDYDSAVSVVRPTHVRFDGDLYKILRVYRKKPSNSIELTLVEAE